MNLNDLTDRIINENYRLSQKDDLTFFETESLEILARNADRLQNAYKKNAVELCCITSGRNGRCSENCKFCAQSGWYNTGCASKDFPEPEELLKQAEKCAGQGIKRFSIVSSGRGLSEFDEQKACLAFSKIRERTGMSVCASFGFLTENQLAKLKDSGVTRIHCNIETSENFFPSICTTHTYKMKVEMVRLAKSMGFSVCSGGIIGMGESLVDRIQLALQLASLKVESIPVNVLTPIPGTPFENRPILTEDEILRTIAIFRFINPEADIRLAGGRKLYSSCKALKSGASASITGDYLTTYGYTIDSDKQLLSSLSRNLR